jgi:hypothetical protein
MQLLGHPSKLFQYIHRQVESRKPSLDTWRIAIIRAVFVGYNALCEVDCDTVRNNFSEDHTWIVLTGTCNSQTVNTVPTIRVYWDWMQLLGHPSNRF